MKRSGRLIRRTIEEEEEIEALIHHLGPDYFFIGLIKQLVRPPTMTTIFILWNRKINYYKEQCLESTMGKHKLKVASSSKAKRMKSKTKDTNVEIHPRMLDQIHFSMCMYITMWVAKKKSKHAWMIEIKLNNFYWLDWNTINLLVVKEIICGFWVQNAISISRGKQISLNSFNISQNFKLLAQGISIHMQETYNEE
jgi:hypothetical protein